MIVLAHAGHVIVDMLYALPLVVMISLLLIGRYREKRARRLDPGSQADNS